MISFLSKIQKLPHRKSGSKSPGYESYERRSSSNRPCWCNYSAVQSFFTYHAPSKNKFFAREPWLNSPSCACMFCSNISILSTFVYFSGGRSLRTRDPSLEGTWLVESLHRGVITSACSIARQSALVWSVAWRASIRTSDGVASGFEKSFEITMQKYCWIVRMHQLPMLRHKKNSTLPSVGFHASKFSIFGSKKLNFSWSSKIEILT